MANHTDIVSKIQKLLSLADPDRGGSEAEVVLAMERAQQLLRKHGLSMAEVAQQKGEKKVTFDIQRHASQSRRKRGFAHFEAALLWAVAKLTETHPITTRFAGTTQLVYVGEQADAAVAAWMYPALLKDLRTRARRCCGAGWTPSHRSFAEGYAGRVHERVLKLKKKPAPACYALVVRGKERAIEEALAGVKPASQRKKNQGAFDAEAHLFGTMAGDRADLGRNRLGS